MKNVNRASMLTRSLVGLKQAKSIILCGLLLILVLMFGVTQVNYGRCVMGKNYTRASKYFYRQMHVFHFRSCKKENLRPNFFLAEFMNKAVCCFLMLLF